MSKTAKLDISKAFQELEEITEWFESKNTDLNEGLKKYERAMDLAEIIHQQLEIAENKIGFARTKDGIK